MGVNKERNDLPAFARGYVCAGTQSSFGNRLVYELASNLTRRLKVMESRC